MSVAMLRVFCSDNTEVLVERELLQVRVARSVDVRRALCC